MTKSKLILGVSSVVATPGISYGIYHVSTSSSSKTLSSDNVANDVPVENAPTPEQQTVDNLEVQQDQKSPTLLSETPLIPKVESAPEPLPLTPSATEITLDPSVVSIDDPVVFVPSSSTEVFGASTSIPTGPYISDNDANSMIKELNPSTIGYSFKDYFIYDKTDSMWDTNLSFGKSFASNSRVLSTLDNHFRVSQPQLTKELLQDKCMEAYSKTDGTSFPSGSSQNSYGYSVSTLCFRKGTTTPSGGNVTFA